MLFRIDKNNVTLFLFNSLQSEQERKGKREKKEKEKRQS
jgi:hypothetical protein